MGAIFLRKKKNACGNVVSRWGLPKIWVPIFWKKTVPAATWSAVQGFQKYGGGFKNMGAIFLKKKSACGNVVSH